MLPFDPPTPSRDSHSIEPPCRHSFNGNLLQRRPAPPQLLDPQLQLANLAIDCLNLL